MKYIISFSFLLLSVWVSAQNRFDVSSSSEFSAAQNAANSGDSIVWQSGIYSNTRMDIDKDGLIVTAESNGTVMFTGVSRAVINANNVTFSGFQYIGGFIGNLHVIRVFGSDVLITEVNIQNYTSYKYLIMDETCRRNTISYCNFENRINLEDQNILSVLVDDEPGFHKIQHCSFKNFDGVGLDEGIEPIRIGVSTQGHLDSRTLVEYCYFTQCNGDGEIISHKSRQNVYRYNTFENNPVAQLVLRHGDEGIVYGNYFLNNLGGIRIREGSDHFIYNNYFEGIDKNAIWLMNDPADPLSNIHIYNNTFINSQEIRLGGIGNNPPSNVTIANNIFANPVDKLFDEETGNESWIGNLSFGNLGIELPSTGLIDTDPKLYENADGFFQPESDSPVIASSSEGYPAVPLYPGMDYDNDIFLDLMKETRPALITDRAIGASEFSSTINVQPHATEMNTGPTYLFDNLIDYVTANASQLYIAKEGGERAIHISSNVDWTITDNIDWVSTNLSSGSGDSQLIITIDANQESVSRSETLIISGASESVSIQIFQDASPVNVFDANTNDLILFPNPTDGRIILRNIPSGINSALIDLIDVEGNRIFSSEYGVDKNELELDLNELVSGTYLLHANFKSTNTNINSKVTRKLVINK